MRVFHATDLPDMVLRQGFRARVRRGQEAPNDGQCCSINSNEKMTVPRQTSTSFYPMFGKITELDRTTEVLTCWGFSLTRPPIDCPNPWTTQPETPIDLDRRTKSNKYDASTRSRPIAQSKLL